MVKNVVYIHKVKHGVQLLQMLDAGKLYTDFADFKRLIDEINIH